MYRIRCSVCSIAYLIAGVLIMIINCMVYASNSGYIALSNQIARKHQLEIVANNAANTNTTGYEADNLYFKNIDVKQDGKRSNSFVSADGMYKNGNKGGLLVTNRPMDLAIVSDGYFKVLTPKGDRYTLNGEVFINSEYVLVNAAGLPFSNLANQPIIIPVDTKEIRFTEDGSVYADNDAVDVLGIFAIADVNKLVKEGYNLYRSMIADSIIDDDSVRIVSGALRSSNVNSVTVMNEMVELQRSMGVTNNLMSGIADLERSVITKIAK